MRKRRAKQQKTFVSIFVALLFSDVEPVLQEAIEDVRSGVQRLQQAAQEPSLEPKTCNSKASMSRGSMGPFRPRGPVLLLR